MHPPRHARARLAPDHRNLRLQPLLTIDEWPARCGPRMLAPARVGVPVSYPRLVVCYRNKKLTGFGEAESGEQRRDVGSVLEAVPGPAGDPQAFGYVVGGVVVG